MRIDERYDEFAAAMRDSWPGCQSLRGDGLLRGYYASIQNVDMADIRRSIKRLREQDWDAPKPSLKMLKQMLMGESDHDSLQALLASVRLGMRAAKVPDCEHMTDQEVFNAHLNTIEYRWRTCFAHRARDCERCWTAGEITRRMEGAAREKRNEAVAMADGSIFPWPAQIASELREAAPYCEPKMNDRPTGVPYKRITSRPPKHEVIGEAIQTWVTREATTTEAQHD